jgi:hypothetical protein
MGLLDKLKEEKEKDNPTENQTLNKSVDKSLKKESPVIEVLKKTDTLNNKFIYPVTLFNPASKSKLVKIAYQVSYERFEAVKQQLGETAAKEVGLQTFKYYYDNEL